jgi:Velvet factor
MPDLSQLVCFVSLRGEDGVRQPPSDHQDETMDTSRSEYHHQNNGLFNPNTTTSFNSKSQQYRLGNADMGCPPIPTPLQHCMFPPLGGTLCRTCTKYVGMDGSPVYYFLFPDLVVHMPGRHRLCFLLMDLQEYVYRVCIRITVKSLRTCRSMDRGSSRAKATTLSDVFRAYSTKKYPGNAGDCVV